MNLYELSQLDIENLKNVDWNQARRELFRRKDSLIILLLLIATPVASFYTFSLKRQEAKKLKTAIALLEKKVQAMENLTTAKKEFENYASQFPEDVLDDQLIGKLTDFAANHNIQILSFSPLQRRSEDYYDITSVSLNVLANNFSDLRAFFTEIEESAYPIRVDGWAMNLDSPLTYAPNEKNTIRSTIEFGSLHVKK